MRASSLVLAIVAVLSLLGLIISSSAGASDRATAAFGAVLGLSGVAALVAFAYRMMAGDPSTSVRS